MTCDQELEGFLLRELVLEAGEARLMLFYRRLPSPEPIENRPVGGDRQRENGGAKIDHRSAVSVA